MDAKATGGLIARRRKEKNWSQGDLAERLHVTDKAISKWETGRGLPSVDLLEPLAEALGLTVSELLSGRELTAEELPKAAGEQIMESMRKGRKLLWRGAAAAVAVIALAGGLYIGYHYATSVAEGDLAGLARQAQNLVRLPDDLSEDWPRPDIAFQEESAEIVMTDQKGDYLGALYADGEGNWNICVYDRDPVFPERWRADGGTVGMEYGEINSHDFGIYGNAIITIGGWGLPDEVSAYSFWNDGVTYICELEEKGGFLDVFLLPDNHDIAPHDLTLLDETGAPLPYENPWEPGLT